MGKMFEDGENKLGQSGGEERVNRRADMKQKKEVNDRKGRREREQEWEERLLKVNIQDRKGREDKEE